MGAFVKEVYRGAYYEVSFDRGSTSIVPEEVCGQNPTVDGLRDYVDGPIDEDYDDVIVRKEGWYGRWTMPGYMDCTDWCADDTEAGLMEQLAAYGEDDEDDE